MLYFSGSIECSKNQKNEAGEKISDDGNGNLQES
jgi:hypothetical protein